MKLPSKLKALASFTLIELLVVIAIIVVLAGLVVSGAGYANKKAARARAEAEIAAMSTALESYKADNGIYPEAGNITFTGGNYSMDPNTYKTASLALYKALAGDTNGDRIGENGTKTYFEFKDNQLSPSTGAIQFIADPFGYSYGYSTLYSTTNGSQGINPTFDLWSTGGRTASGDATVNRANWITNW